MQMDGYDAQFVAVKPRTTKHYMNQQGNNGINIKKIITTVFR